MWYTYPARTAAVVAAVAWLAMMYLSYAQLSDAASSVTIVNGWQTRDKSTLFDPDGPTQIARSLGGWCSGCGKKGQKPCPAACWGQARTGGVVAPDRRVPHGITTVSAPECQASCERQYNRSTKAIDGTPVSADEACEAWEWDAQSGSCFTYVLSSYPPRTVPDPFSTTGVAVNSIERVALSRQLAATAMYIVPLALAFAAYRNFAAPGSPRINRWAAAIVPMALAVVAMTYISGVGFSSAAPRALFACDSTASMKMACRANTLVGGRTSGSCYNGCCGATITCPVEAGLDKDEGIWTTCTFPNVVCADGSCAGSTKMCDSNTRGGLHDGKGCTSGGSSPHKKRSGGGTGREHGGDYANDCDAKTWLGNHTNLGPSDPTQPISDFPGIGGYRGEANCDLPVSVRRAATNGRQCMPPGRSVNAIWGKTSLKDKKGRYTEKGAYRYPVFTMTPALRETMKQYLTMPNGGTEGCGMSTNPAVGEEQLFVIGSESALFCQVASTGGTGS